MDIQQIFSAVNEKNLKGYTYVTPKDLKTKQIEVGFYGSGQMVLAFYYKDYIFLHPKNDKELIWCANFTKNKVMSNTKKNYFTFILDENGPNMVSAHKENDKISYIAHKLIDWGSLEDLILGELFCIMLSSFIVGIRKGYGK